MRRPATLVIISCGTLALLLFVLQDFALAQLTGGQLDAASIYDRVRSTLATRIIPPYIAYTQYVAFVRHGKVQAERARVVLRMADGKANITRIADSPADRVDTQPHIKDRPLVYPTSNFGLVKRRTGELPSAFESAPSGPPVIGRVSATSRDYDATLVGTETLNGANVYHLKMQPRFDPQHHPVRELYVDTTSFDPRRIAIEVWATAGPVRLRPTVNVDFAPVGGTWLIAHAAMDFTLRFAFLSYAGSAEYRTSDVEFPASQPDWMFDPRQLNEHTRVTH